ncbi:Protein TOXD [Madurella mycetomatis]|uniref:Protein TOXD n=1 Tax=Madurella mycetomatis TaxID=100816 RepID=A0A175VQP9_9PEZI|nr:Protein TOXD [Madurella mycetomatis]
MRAIKTVADHQAEIQEVPIPAVRYGYILVKVKAVALNPTDWKHIDIAAPPGTTVGCDFSGVVQEVGSGVQRSWKRGDRIAGFAHGGNEVQPEDGCFAEYCVVKDGIGFKIPDHMTDEEACTLGIGVTTVGQALYQSLALPLPGANPEAAANFPILINGGSTATGSLAIQYARLSGCSSVITTCSEHNFALVEAIGTHAAFDYRDPRCAQQIRERTADKLAHALDCVSTKESAEICAAAIGSAGGAVSYLLPVKHEREDVQVKYTLGYTVFGEYFRVAGGREFAARPEDFEFGRMFWELSERLITDGRIRVHPPEIGKDGLRGVFEGLQAMREGRVSGRKLVYRIDETP